MLDIRPYAKGTDEPIQVRICNECFANEPDYVPLTVEELKIFQEAPDADNSGKLVAELDGEPIGFCNARVEKNSPEKKGFIPDFAILPQYRRKGYGRLLYAKALESLTARGMESVEIWIWDGAWQAREFLESLGYGLVRTSGIMGRQLAAPLKDAPSVEGVNIVCSDLSAGDLAIQNRLDNEAFKEHYNYRPRTMEETEFLLFKNPGLERPRMFFAMMGGEPVGYTIVIEDTKWREQKGEIRGWILDIGVLKSHRGGGIGAALMAFGLGALKDAGMAEAVLGVDAMNETGALRLYERAGFKFKSRYQAYLKTI
ncbi:MAG: GNAT family N-acetyltransferase [Methanobacteriota archaeon]